MEFVNLTPHPLTIDGAPGGARLILGSSGEIARVSMEYTDGGDVRGVPITIVAYGEVTGLPEPRAGVVFIVSGMVEAAVAGTRDDVYSPGELVRNDQGQVVSCKGLKQSRT